MLNTVQVPKQFEPIFQKAQEYASKYFKEKKEDPSKGTIEIFGERYILVRAASMSIDFFETVENLYKDRGEKKALNIARSFLFDIAHAIGKQDAKNFHKKLKLKDPIEKLSAGPVHFSHSGWAFVNIFPESRPTPDENFYLIYEHLFSFESDAWEKKGKKPDFPVCVMNAGYSSGWCEESFGVPLVASEITCKAKGDEACRFIMAHPSKIKGYIKEYLKEEPKLAKKVTKYEMPGFFKRKQIEDERKRTEQKQDELIKKVEHINKELKEFAYIVSHDLKAPLRGIKTLANWILADSADKLGDQANEQMNLLLERVERMYNLIEGALQYSRAGRVEGRQVQVNLNNFVPEIINMVVPPENITVTIENELPVIECEETHIMQVFQNLLSNAIKYMDKPQGWIKVGCVEQDGFWKFSVADNGPGIEEKHFVNIFKIFQALPTSPDFKGTGVGLTVAKKIVELYDGKIWVESKVGEGSTFFFTLPKQKVSRIAGTKMGAKNEKLEANITR